MYGVLGSTGFLGSHIMAYLDQAGIPHTGGSRRTGVDCRVARNIIDWIYNQDITVIINLAAECGGIGLNKTHPATLWLATTQITAAVLQAAHSCNINKLVQVGTVCSYAKDCPVPFKESDLMNYGQPESTNAAYGVAKLNGLYGCQSYRRQYGMDAIYLLPVNMYGPKDNFDPQSSHVIPALIQKIAHAKENGHDKIEIWGTGTPTREFIHARDAARAIVMAAEKYSGEEPINIGTGSEISIADLAELIKEEIGWGGEFIYNNSKPDGQPRRCLDVSKAKDILGFEANISLRDGIRETVDWWEKAQ